MADTYEQNLGQKSSLTKSDFIRVVGSDNVSYKQLVSDVNKTIPLNTVGGLTTEALIDQAYITAHTETPDGMPYRRLMYHGFAHSILGGGVYYLEGYRASSSYGWQRITCYGNPTRVFIRSINNDTWTTWAKTPTRAEVDALSNKADVYHIEYAATASTSGTRYYSPSISGAIDSIATKGAGRYMVECIRNTSYSDSYNSITSANMTLIVDVLGASYINVIGIQLNNSTSVGDIILKRAKSPTWGGWIKMPTRAEIDALTTSMGVLKVFRSTANATTYTFTVANANRFRYFLLIGGSSAGAPFIYHGFISTDNAVALNKIIDPASRTVSASYNGTTLTITSTATLYGGVRILYLD